MLTDEQVRKRRIERKKKERLRRRRIVYARRACAVAVLLLVVLLIGKGVGSICKLFSKDDEVKQSQEVSNEVEHEKPEQLVDEYLELASKIDISTINVLDDDEIGNQLLEMIEEYPQVKIILANRNNYPEEIVKLLIRNQETLKFVLDYPKENKKEHDIIVEPLEEGKIPHYLQWDEQWGYQEYGNNIIAISGCGPTSLSMITTYLLQDDKYNPSYMANFSQENGYCTSVGTDWLFMSEGADKLGLNSKMVNLDENDVARELNEGHPIICSMGPGDFTDAGHFIVLTHYEDGYVTINDPNSNANSSHTWKFEDIINQIKNIWAFSLK